MKKYFYSMLLLLPSLLMAACSGTGSSSVSTSVMSSLQSSSVAPSSQSAISSASSSIVISSVTSSSITASSSALAVSSKSSVSSLAANKVPTVSFSYPSNGAVLPYKSSVDVVANADDSDGTIVNATLYLNDQVVASIAKAPFKWPASVLPQLSTLNPAIYSLRVVVTDDRGATQSAVVSFEVLEQNNFPSVSFMMPKASLNLFTGANMDVIVNANDSDGSIMKVGFYINNELLSEDSIFPYEWYAAQYAKLTQMPVGNYELKALATDNKGGVSIVTQSLTISASAATTAGDPARGEQQYLQSCMSCHGQFGEGYSSAPALVPAKSSYSVGNQNYSLYAMINEFMPKDYAAGCAGQCARNVATYIRENLESKNKAHKLLVADAVTGKVEYQLQCVSCHGERGLGGSTDVMIFPLKEGKNYSLGTFYIFSDVDLFSMIDIGMPKGPKGYPEGYADACSGQCAVDVAAYLKELQAQLTPAELKTAQIASGKNIYLGQCSSCHNGDGRKNGIIPLTSQEVSKNTLDANDPLFVYNRDFMPKGSPKNCIGQCAKDVSVYIREVLNK